MERDLRIGRLIEGICGSNRLGLTETIDFNHPRCDRALGRLPDEARGEPSREEETSERHQPPVSGLDTGRADALVPNLRRFLVGRHRLRHAAIVRGRSLEHQCPPSDRSTEDPPPALSPLRTAWVAADTPWFTVCPRFMRRAQAGGASAVDEPPPSPAAMRRNGLTIAEPPALATPPNPPAR